MIAATDELLWATEPAARAIRGRPAPARLHEAHQRGLRWAERLAVLDASSYDLRTIAGRLERDIDVIERRMESHIVKHDVVPALAAPVGAQPLDQLLAPHRGQP